MSGTFELTAASFSYLQAALTLPCWCIASNKLNTCTGVLLLPDTVYLSAVIQHLHDKWPASHAYHDKAQSFIYAASCATSCTT